METECQDPKRSKTATSQETDNLDMEVSSPSIPSILHNSPLKRVDVRYSADSSADQYMSFDNKRFRIVKNDGGGNCLFLALSQWLTGEHSSNELLSHAREIRQTIASVVVENWHRFGLHSFSNLFGNDPVLYRDFLVNSSNLQFKLQYKNEMEKDGTFASPSELLAASVFFRRNFSFVKREENIGGEFHLMHTFNEWDNGEPVYFLFSGSIDFGHWELLQEVENSDVSIYDSESSDESYVPSDSDWEDQKKCSNKYWEVVESSRKSAGGGSACSRDAKDTKSNLEKVIAYAEQLMEEGSSSEQQLPEGWTLLPSIKDIDIHIWEPEDTEKAKNVSNKVAKGYEKIVTVVPTKISPDNILYFFDEYLSPDGEWVKRGESKLIGTTDAICAGVKGSAVLWEVTSTRGKKVVKPTKKIVEDFCTIGRNDDYLQLSRHWPEKGERIGDDGTTMCYEPLLPDEQRWVAKGTVIFCNGMKLILDDHVLGNPDRLELCWRRDVTSSISSSGKKAMPLKSQIWEQMAGAARWKHKMKGTVIGPPVDTEITAKGLHFFEKGVDDYVKIGDIIEIPRINLEPVQLKVQRLSWWKDRIMYTSVNRTGYYYDRGAPRSLDSWKRIVNRARGSVVYVSLKHCPLEFPRWMSDRTRNLLRRGPTINDKSGAVYVLQVIGKEEEEGYKVGSIKAATPGGIVGRITKLSTENHEKYSHSFLQPTKFRLLLEKMIHTQLVDFRHHREGIAGGTEYFYIQLEDLKNLILNLDAVIDDAVSKGYLKVPKE